MSAYLYLHTELATRRAEVEVDGGTLWLRVDGNVAAWTPHTQELVRELRACADKLEATLMTEAA